MQILDQRAISNIRQKLAGNSPALKSFDSWVSRAAAADWSCHNDLRLAPTHSPDPVGSDRIVFDIGHNAFRLVVRVQYPKQVLRLHWFGTHREYDRIDVESVPGNL